MQWISERNGISGNESADRAGKQSFKKGTLYLKQSLLKFFLLTLVKRYMTLVS